jgi:hypothetical protein
MMLPYPLTISPSFSVVITDTAEQSAMFLLDDSVISLNEDIILKNRISLQSGHVYCLQRDIVSDVELAKILYNVDLTIHVAPDQAVNSNSSCLVQWWRKTKSGKVESGQGRLVKSNDQLLYTARKKEVPTITSIPSSTFNLFTSEKQNEQKSSLVLPYFKAQQDPDLSSVPGFDSDDPDADLDI